MLQKIVIVMCVLGLVCSTAIAGKKKKKGKGGILAILKTLDLTGQQEAKVDELVASYREKLKAAGSKDEKKEARQAFESDLENILTAEQMEKYREAKKKQRGSEPSAGEAAEDDQRR